MKTAIIILLAAVFVALLGVAVAATSLLIDKKEQEAYQNGFNKAAEMDTKMAKNQASKALAQMLQSYSVKDIIVTKDNKTVVKWNDGKTTWVKLKEGDVNNPFKAFCYCLLKQMYGDAWKEMFKRHGVEDTQAENTYEVHEEKE